MLKGLVKFFVLGFIGIGLMVTDGSGQSRANAQVGKEEAVSQAWMNRYLEDTIKGLDKIRSPFGVVADKAILDQSGQIHLVHASMSPTNIGLDLLLQASLPENDRSYSLVEKNLSFLESLEIHPPSGLFFNWYTLELPSRVTGRNVSSIDNLHLAIALWTVGQRWPETEVSRRANALFKRMDFSMYIDKKSGMIGGNFRPIGDGWERDAYNFDHFGSEARSLYSAGLALGLFRSYQASDVQKNSMAHFLFRWNADSSSSSSAVLRTWDGGAFQLLLPEILIGESKHSRFLAEVFSGYADLVFKEGQDRGYPFALGFSASSFGFEGDRFGNLPGYRGHLGHPSLVSHLNGDFKKPNERRAWDQVSTPHALFLAIRPSHWQRFEKSFAAMEAFSDQWGPLYRQGLGFLDAFHVSGPYKNEIVPSVISLDHLMIALSLCRQLDSDLQLAFEKHYRQHPNIADNIREFYKMVDSKLLF